MTAQPVLTIGIMTHNYGRFLGEAIESVRTQRFSQWEMIISDDASTDETPEVIAPYLADARITTIRHENRKGQAGNWEYLLSAGTAPYLAALHADDYYLPGALEKAAEAFQADQELDLFCGNWLRKVEGKEELTPRLENQARSLTGHEEVALQVKRYTYLPSATFLSRRVASLAGVPNPAFRLMIDQEYLLRAALHSRRTRAVAEPLMVYRVHGSSVTDATRHLANDERELLAKLCAEQFAPYPDLRESQEVLRRAVAEGIFSSGVTTAARGDLAAGRAEMQRGVKFYPELLSDPIRRLDYTLSRLGAIGRLGLRALHRNRLRD